ncbi:hypothetical protein [Nostoc sp. NZL]|uniref:hypothetical protein n=1 Tax=Nostoc sp. NZL TaxID=2650612 RepID=UPI0018C5E28A|nr:hypothetical protein [Nostoc sp. NZL]MBG1245011.1 hypothetical protein [Nostoc sp. NZL]
MPTNYKKPPVGVSQPGELVIRVHLPVIFSKVNGSLPDKLAEVEIVSICLPNKTSAGVCQPEELVISTDLPIKLSVRCLKNGCVRNDCGFRTYA